MIGLLPMSMYTSYPLPSESSQNQRHLKCDVGGGPRVVVSTATFHARVRGSVPGLGGLKETKLFLPHPRVKVSIVGSLRDREVACSASDCLEDSVTQSSHHPQEVLLAQFSLYVHKGGLKPDSFHFILFEVRRIFLSWIEFVWPVTVSQLTFYMWDKNHNKTVFITR